MVNSIRSNKRRLIKGNNLLTRVLPFIFCLTNISNAEDLAESIQAAQYRARVAIIIDDLGYNLEPLTAVTSNPHALTLAIIPHTPYGKTFAERAYKEEKEVMLHTPMETLGQTKWERGLRVDMAQEELTNTLRGMLEDIPHVRGVNNHGGSKLTQNKERMGWLMTVLREQDLYFVDSRTVASTQAQIAADEAMVANASRDVFLDNEKDPENIREQLEKLLAIALRDGQAIGIGHPYPETLQVLEEDLSLFLTKGVQIVSASDVLFRPSIGKNHIALKSADKPPKN